MRKIPVLILFVFIAGSLYLSESQEVNYQVFHPGDALKVISFPDTSGFPNGRYLINDSGFVHFPLIGSVNVSVRTRSELESILSEKYIRFLQNPDIQVKPLIRASILGGFNRPGLYWIDPEKSLWELVRRAGGTQRDDGIEKIEWKRDSGAVSTDLTSILQSGESLNHCGFKSGDQLTLTNRSNRRVIDIFLSDVFPVMSFILSAAASSATLYLTYQALEND